MPNHVKNIVKFSSDVETIREFMKSAESDFDFNNLIPMPKSLDIESSSRMTRGIEAFLTMINPKTKDYGTLKMPEEVFTMLEDKVNKDYSFATYSSELPEEQITKWAEKEKEFEETLELGKIAIQNILNYGTTDWYHWRIENWGTKWNAYEIEVIDKGFTFETAWSIPYKVMIALSKKFPKVTITHKWADEDIGYNCGNAKYLNGEEIMVKTEDDYADSRKFARGVWEEC